MIEEPFDLVVIPFSYRLMKCAQDTLRSSYVWLNLPIRFRLTAGQYYLIERSISDELCDTALEDPNANCRSVFDMTSPDR